MDIYEWRDYLEEHFDLQLYDNETYNVENENIQVICMETRGYHLTIGKTYRLREIEVRYSYNEMDETDELQSIYFRIKNDDGVFVRYNCELFDTQIILKENIPKCHYCETPLDRFNTCIVELDDKSIKTCVLCYHNNNYHRCVKCGVTKNINMDYLPNKHIKKVENQNYYCTECFKEETEKGINKCKVCNSLFFKTNEHSRVNNVCYDCISKKHEVAERIFPLKTPNPLKFRSTSKHRTIGVELEVFGNDFLITEAQKLRKALDKHKYKHLKLSELLFAKRDGSLENFNSVEFNTAVLLNDTEGLNTLRTIIDIMKENFSTDKKCGLHVHFGVNDLDEKDLKNLYYFYLKFEDNLKYYVPKDRITNYYCRKMMYMPPSRIKNLIEIKNSRVAAERYKAVNFNSLKKYGTLEIRLMDGNLNSDRIIEWIQLHSRVIQYVKENKDILDKYVRLTDNKVKEILGTKLFEDFLERRKYYQQQEKIGELGTKQYWYNRKMSALEFDSVSNEELNELVDE